MNKIKNENWRQIIEFKEHKEVYISNFGRVKNKDGIILKQRYDKYGYRRISFTFFINGKKSVKTRFTHRLVATEFLENPNNYPQVKFKNGNKNDICVENLEWCRKANSKSRNSRCKNKSILNIDTNEKFNNISTAAKYYNIGIGSLYNCCINKTRTAGGYRWRYIN